MARFRVRFRLNPGRHGAPLDKLGEFSTQVERFLRSLSSDLGIEIKKGEWIARNFSEGSIEFDTDCARPVPPSAASRGFSALNIITGASPLEAVNQGFVSYGTMAEYSRIGKTIDPDEHFDVGLYNDDGSGLIPTEWKQVSYGQAAEVKQLLDAPYISYGSVQGVMHAWIMEGGAQSFTVRDLSSGDLVKCSYDKTMYGKVHEATETSGCVLIVYGDMQWDRATNSVIELSVTDLQITRRLTETEFNGLFGAVPTYVGSLTSTEYIDWLRGDGE